MRKITVAYLIDTVSCDTAGTQKQLIETLARLDREAFSPQLVCLRESPWMREHSLPCPVTVLGYRGFLKRSFPGVVRRLAELMREVDIVQTFFVESIFVAWFAWLLAPSRPVLISSRRDIGLGQGNEPGYHRLFRALLPLVNRSFRGILANSEEVRGFVAQRERVPLAKITVVKNGVELPAPAPRPALFEEPGVVWVAMVASLTPVKRQDLLLRAAAALPGGQGGRVRLLLLGEGPEEGRLRELAARLGIADRVVFAGAVGNPAAYLPHVDLCVLCSDREGLSNAILEYMACGKPVIATAVGGNPELVGADNGLLVPPGDAQALARAIAALTGDRRLRARLGAGSLARVRREYSWRRTMDETQAYYRTVVGGP